MTSIPKNGSSFSGTVQNILGAGWKEFAHASLYFSLVRGILFSLYSYIHEQHLKNGYRIYKRLSGKKLMWPQQNTRFDRQKQMDSNGSEFNTILYSMYCAEFLQNIIIIIIPFLYHLHPTHNQSYSHGQNVYINCITYIKYIEVCSCVHILSAVKVSLTVQTSIDSCGKHPLKCTLGEWQS